MFCTTTFAPLFNSPRTLLRFMPLCLLPFAFHASLKRSNMFLRMSSALRILGGPARRVFSFFLPRSPLTTQTVQQEPLATQKLIHSVHGGGKDNIIVVGGCLLFLTDKPEQLLVDSSTIGKVILYDHDDRRHEKVVSGAPKNLFMGVPKHILHESEGVQQGQHEDKWDCGETGMWILSRDDTRGQQSKLVISNQEDRGAFSGLHRTGGRCIPESTKTSSDSSPPPAGSTETTTYRFRRVAGVLSVGDKHRDLGSTKKGVVWSYGFDGQKGSVYIDI